MTTFGIHASHEQIPPSTLLDCVRLAESAGFRSAMCSDHFAPWSERQGESGFAWSWLGAALATTSLPFGVVNTPGQRYHPAVIAQAAATLAEMFPGRFWVALGSGQALNEHITGDRWPVKPVRNRRLRECVDIMRALFAGEEVSWDGLVRVDRARLWTLPAQPPALVGAAVSVETARWAGGWADGLITVNQSREHLERMIEAFRDGGGDGKPLFLQVHLSWAPDEEEAWAIAHDQWRANMLPSVLAWELELPVQFDEATKHTQPEHLRQSVLVSSDLKRHIEWLEELRELGFDQINLHHVGQHQQRFIETFGQDVLPALTRSAP